MRTARPSQPLLVSRTGERPIPRLALRKEEAAVALGVSDETFDRYVRDDLCCVRVGSVRLWPVSELERWLLERAEPVLPVRATRGGAEARTASGTAAGGASAAQAGRGA